MAPANSLSDLRSPRMSPRLENVATTCSSRRSSATTPVPMKPLPPITRIRMNRIIFSRLTPGGSPNLDLQGLRLRCYNPPMTVPTKASAIVPLGVLCLVAFLIPEALSGQAGLRTPDGRPDLQGTWNFSSLTPLERPAQFADKAVLTEEEAALFERQTLDRNNADRRRDTAEADVAQAYNDAWYDRGTKTSATGGRHLTSLIVDPPDGKIPALTSAGQARAARADARRQRGSADGPEDRSLGERCLLFNAGPPMLSGPYNNFVQIHQSSDYVVILNEMIHDSRIVPLDGRPHLPQGIRRLLGDSRGRWDGNTLVVETTNFSDKTNVRGSGEHLRLTERFTRADAKTLLYEFTVDDPGSFVRPWTAVLPMSKTDDQIYEYACHEGNYAMTGILRGARASDGKNR